MNPYHENLKALHMKLPEPPKPIGSYRPVVVSGSLAFLSGQIAKSADGQLLTGKVGKAITLEKGQEAARAAALNVISVIDKEIGFDRFKRLSRIVGYVQCDPGFTDLHLVMNGASELFHSVFGEAGIHARSAVGMASLPLNSSVEIEATVELQS